MGTFLSFSLMFCHCEPSILPTSPKEMLGLSLVMFSRWALQKNMYGASARLGRQSPPLLRFIAKPLGLVGAALLRPREDEALAAGPLRPPRAEARALAIVADLLINKYLQTTDYFLYMIFFRLIPQVTLELDVIALPVSKIRPIFGGVEAHPRTTSSALSCPSPTLQVSSPQYLCSKNLTNLADCVLGVVESR